MFLTQKTQTCRQILYYCYYLFIITILLHETLLYTTFIQCNAQEFVLAAQPAADSDNGSVRRPPRQATVTNNQVISANTNSSSFDLGSINPHSEWKVSSELEKVSKPPDGSCDTMIVPLCNDVGWNTTIKPFKNHFNHTTQDLANEELNKFGGLFIMCKDINLFLCSLFAPQCTVVAPVILKPCQHVCTSVKNQCEQYLTTYYNNVSILDPWKCHEFPTPEEDPTCVGDHNKAPTHVPLPEDLPETPTFDKNLFDKNPFDELAKCSDTQFDCKHENRSKPLCIDNKFRCDGAIDCKDTHQDELNCPCSAGSFHCVGKCLPINQLCDGIVDCQDGSDEGSNKCPQVTQISHISPIPQVPEPPLEQTGFDYIKVVVICVSVLTFIGVVTIRSCREDSDSKKSSTGMGMNGILAPDDETRNASEQPFANIMISHTNQVQPLPPTPTYTYQESTYGRLMPGTSTSASSTYGNNYYQRCPASSTHDDSDLGREEPTYILPTLRNHSSEDIPRAPPPTPDLEYGVRPSDGDGSSYFDYDNDNIFS